MSQHSLTLNSVLITCSITTLFAIIFGFFALKLFKVIIVKDFFGEVKKTFSLSVALSVTTLINSLSVFIASLIYSHFMGLALFGAISFFWNIFGPLNIIHQAFNNYLMPKINQMFKSKTSFEVNRYLKKRTLFLIGITAFYGLMAFLILYFFQNYLGLLKIDTEINQIAYIILMTLFLGLFTFMRLLIIHFLNTFYLNHLT